MDGINSDEGQSVACSEQRHNSEQRSLHVTWPSLLSTLSTLSMLSFTHLDRCGRAMHCSDYYTRASLTPEHMYVACRPTPSPPKRGRRRFGGVMGQQKQSTELDGGAAVCRSTSTLMGHGRRGQTAGRRGLVTEAGHLALWSRDRGRGRGLRSRRERGQHSRGISRLSARSLPRSLGPPY